MRRSQRPLIIAARPSALSRTQTQGVAQLLQLRHPALKIEHLWIRSQADQMPEADLSTHGGKGLYIRTVERALLSGEADLAVHSLKDVPAQATEQTRGLVIAAVPMREDARDALLTHHGVMTLAQLPQGAKVGTSSPRRAAQLKRLRPDLVIEPIRGNIETRVAKVCEHKLYDATILALAGLKRSGIALDVVTPLDPSIMLPAAGQGALAVQTRADDHVTLGRCLSLNHAPSSSAVNLERTVTAALEGDCHTAVAAYAEPLHEGLPGDLRLRVRWFHPDGHSVVELDRPVPVRGYKGIVKQIIRELKQQIAR